MSFSELFEKFKNDLTSTADAIRAKTGKTDKLGIEDFASEIEGIEVGSEAKLQELIVTENGEYTPHGIKAGDWVHFKPDLSGFNIDQFRSTPIETPMEGVKLHVLVKDPATYSLIGVLYADEGAAANMLYVSNRRDECVYCFDDALPEGPGWYKLSLSERYRYSSPTARLSALSSDYNTSLESLMPLFVTQNFVSQGVELYPKAIIQRDWLAQVGFTYFWYYVTPYKCVDINAIMIDGKLIGVSYDTYDDATSRFDYCNWYWFEHPADYLDSWQTIDYDGPGWYKSIFTYTENESHTEHMVRCEKPVETIILPTDYSDSALWYYEGNYSQHWLGEIFEDPYSGVDGFSKVSVNVKPDLQKLNAARNGTYKPDEGNDGFSEVIVDVQPVLLENTFTENGTYRPGGGVDGWSKVSVDVQPDLQEINAKENGTYEPDEGVDGFSKVVIDVQPDLQELNVKENGTYTPNEGVDGFSEVVVDVQPNLQELSITENGTYEPEDSDGFSRVVVDVQNSGGGDTSAEDILVVRDMTSYTNDRVTSVGPYAFAGCSGLTNVEFPACTSIGSSAFYVCSLLTSVSFPACTRIESDAFYKCSLLTNVNFPACTRICRGAFFDCQRLPSANFSVCLEIGQNAFAHCYDLTSVSFPECITIYNGAFTGCSGLTNVEFPACTSIWNYAFSSCCGLTSVSFPKCMSIGSSAFISCSGLTNVEFPACTSIAQGAFDGCSGLTSVSFPECMTIGSAAFARCRALTSVSFPECVSIGSRAFISCSGLTNVEFPACTYIGRSAFYDCSSLMTLKLCHSSVANLANADAFASTPMSESTSAGEWGSIYVPASLVDKYKAASNWSYYADRITAIPE